MHSPPADSRPHRPAHSSSDCPGHSAIEPREPRNLLLLAAHQIVLRIGWIFKTESVIMPAFLDAVTGGSGLMRGCLTALNRLGQGVPPLFTANFLRGLRHKRRALVAFTTLMSLPFLIMSVAWFTVGGGQRVWMSGLFLAMYFAFFVLYGLYLVSFGTVQGKLIRPNRRGYLILLSTFWGAVPATLFALWLMPDWLESTASAATLSSSTNEAMSAHWGHIFAFVGVCFFLSGLVALGLFEPDAGASQRPAKRAGSLAESVGVLREDANLRRLVLVAVLSASGLIVIPHYQACAREELGLAGIHLMVWVVAQNAAVAVFSLLAGPLADRRGYRLTMRLLIFASAVAPALAVVLPQLPAEVGGKLFWLVYVLLGVMPLVPRALLNYALEICAPEAHPRYQSIVSLAIAAPFVLSPAVGWLVDEVAPGVFLSTALLTLLGGLLTFRLGEPRHRPRDREADIGSGAEMPE